MNRIAISLAIASMLATHAQARTDPRPLTCQQAQEVVRKAGRIVMNTGPNTWAEVVASSALCRVSSARRQSVQTRDNPACNVGFVCRPRTGGR